MESGNPEDICMFETAKDLKLAVSAFSEGDGIKDPVSKMEVQLNQSSKADTSDPRTACYKESLQIFQLSKTFFHLGK